MAVTLRVADEHFGSDMRGRRTGVDLRLASERVSAREIIRSRVAAEVDEINQRKQPPRSYIIEQGALERALNADGAGGFRKTTVLDTEVEIDNAIAAFSRRQFIMLLDDRQIEDLDATIGLRPDSEVVFVHLRPLKGG
jgi:hypothetical protein